MCMIILTSWTVLAGVLGWSSDMMVINQFEMISFTLHETSAEHDLVPVSVCYTCNQFCLAISSADTEITINIFYFQSYNHT